MPKFSTTKVVKGTIIPDAQSLGKALKSIAKEIKSDKISATSFVKNPDTFLGDRGISADLRRELLAEEGIRMPGADASCRGTCVCSDSCCVTCWIGTGRGSIDELTTSFPELKKGISRITIK